jgi:hypothetical protein
MMVFFTLFLQKISEPDTLSVKRVSSVYTGNPGEETV